MKIRLAIFAAAVLLLPPLAMLLSDQEWPPANVISGNVALPAMLSGIALLACTYLLDTLSFRRSGSSLLRTQPYYALWLSITGAVLGALLSYLNIFSPLWLSPLTRPAELLCATFFGGLLLPAVLIARLWLSGFSVLMLHLTRTPPLPVAAAEPGASLLLLATLIGLLGGTLWQTRLDWLFWLSPLSLLIALQLLWHESTIFSGLKHGDWSRVVLGAASGILMSGGTLVIFNLSGGTLFIATSTWLLTLLLAAFGLLCLQSGDLIAENWRGKKRADVFKKKPFPIPVITQKD